MMTRLRACVLRVCLQHHQHFNYEQSLLRFTTDQRARKKAVDKIVNDIRQKEKRKFDF